MGEEPKETKKFYKKSVVWLLLAAAVVLAAVFYLQQEKKQVVLTSSGSQVELAEQVSGLQMPQLDTAAYDQKLLEIANVPNVASTTAFTTAPSPSPSPRGGGGEAGWPVKTAYPNAGAILPFHRIVAYYGNLYSRGMGILGEYSEDEVLRRLNAEVDKWNKADPSTPVVPALHYIAVVAQAGPGKDGKYRVRMPDKEIDKVLKMAEKVNGIVFLDVQVGKSTVQAEVPLLEKYLKLPNVHLGIDPEFSMKSGARPGAEIGTLDARDINFAAEFLSKVAKENNLAPKILVVHRFTQRMVTNFKDIKPLPEVQVVMDMDGFGSQGSKKNTYRQYIYREPVQFTGFKLFYKNDTAGGRKLLEPEDLLNLTPIPVYIQYQ